MATLTILRAGPLLSVQDSGRHGLLGQGVSASGPMDADYMKIANALVGNRGDEAVVEFAAYGGDMRADADILVAVMAADCDVFCADRALPVGESGWLRAGETLRIGRIRGGNWGYLAIEGGIATPPVLGSRATHLRSAIGGLEGRRLEAGDALPLAATGRRDRAAIPALPARPSGPVRVVPGPQHDYFDDAAWRTFTGTHYAVTPRNDRMGMQLDGEKISAFRGHDIISDVTPPGAVQIPGTGLPVILLAERQPTGGYPKIATVASVDLPRLAQLRAGEKIRFATVTQAEAEDLLRRARRDLDELLGDLRAPASPEQRLMSENLIGGVWGGGRDGD